MPYVILYDEYIDPNTFNKKRRSRKVELTPEEYGKWIKAEVEFRDKFDEWRKKNETS